MPIHYHLMLIVCPFATSVLILSFGIRLYDLLFAFFSISWVIGTTTVFSLSHLLPSILFMIQNLYLVRFSPHLIKLK